MITACLLLAFLGVYEFSTGHANRGILSAIFIEVVLVLAFLYVMYKERKLAGLYHDPLNSKRANDDLI
jgi:hypothetical protein